MNKLYKFIYKRYLFVANFRFYAQIYFVDYLKYAKQIIYKLNFSFFHMNKLYSFNIYFSKKTLFSTVL